MRHNFVLKSGVDGGGVNRYCMKMRTESEQNEPGWMEMGTEPARTRGDGFITSSLRRSLIYFDVITNNSIPTTKTYSNYSRANKKRQRRVVDSPRSWTAITVLDSTAYSRRKVWRTSTRTQSCGWIDGWRWQSTPLPRHSAERLRHDLASSQHAVRHDVCSYMFVCFIVSTSTRRA
jgi:hypothetical protein